MGLVCLACSTVLAKGPGGGGHVARRPLVVGSKTGFAGRGLGGRRALAGGSRLGGFGAGVGFGYGGFGYGGGYGGYGYGDSQGTLLYRLNYIPVPPYFSLHPPVYYGQRIFRTYGDSPYANYPYPRAYRQPSPPQMMSNPTIAIIPVAQKQSKPGQLAAKMVINPFYDGTERPTEIVAQAGKH